MQINKDIFKSYDVRGIYPSELNEEAAYFAGKAFIKHTGVKRVAIGQDARISSPALFKALAEGMISEGAQIYDLGQVLTECVYFAVGNYDFDGGVMITASHNPKEYNGFKMLVKKINLIEMVRGKDLVSLLETGEYVPGDLEILKKDIWKEYSNFMLSFVDLTQLVPLKVVVDCSNGVAGNALNHIQDKLPIEVVLINQEPDGNFPNHSPNPLMPGASDQIEAEITKQKADFGFMFDGDADRVFLVDEKGALVRADAALLLLAKHFLEKNKGMAVAYNAICSKAVPKFVKQWGGNPIRTQVGFVNVRQGLLDNNGIMGGELSGHYCFKDNYYMDSGIIAFLTLISIISKDGRPVSEIIKELSPYAGAEDNFKVKDKEVILEKVKEKYKDGEQDFLDGVTISYKDWWFNLRPSNTEPLLRLTIEADNQEILEEKKKELTKLVK